MSYSFNFTASSKKAAKATFAHEFAKVVITNGQPAHAKEMQAAIAAAHAMIDTLDDNPAKDVYVSANGSVGWDWQSIGYQVVPEHLTSAAFSFSTYLVDRPVPDANLQTVGAPVTA